MAERGSRKRKLAPEAEQYRQGLALAAVQAEQRKKSRTIGKEINTDLSDLFGKMKASDEVPVAEVEMGRGRRHRKTRKVSKKKSRKTRKH